MKLNKDLTKLKNRKIIITAGGTIEPIDPIRYIGNHSSGKMGIAIAKAFSKISNNVVCIYGNVREKLPKNIKCISVGTVKEMYDSIIKNLTKDAVLIMSAAVSDFKVKKVSRSKIKNKTMCLELVPTIDILKSISKRKSNNNFFAGFAVETEDVVKNAEDKLDKKRLDLIVANPVNKDHNPFGSDDNKVYFVSKEKVSEYPVMKKTKIAKELLKYVCRHI